MPSIYYPYFRGKQFELITIRENAPLISSHKICPIIEPVRESLSGLRRTIEALQQTAAKFVLITNPMHGDHADVDAPSISEPVREMLASGNGHSLGFILSRATTMPDVESFIQESDGHPITLIHYGFADPAALASILNHHIVRENIFLDGYCSKLYQRNFRQSKRILVRDGFKKRMNREYPPEESFYDLHLTYAEEGMQGFGDFLIVGDEFSDAGGPAYAVAIHLTFIDPTQQGEMMIRHFKSDRADTPTDPGGKYLEALGKLIAFVDEFPTKVLESNALMEFRRNHEERHFPGLGYVKRLSMQHHIETLADFLNPDN